MGLKAKILLRETITILMLLFPVFIFQGCQKVINVDLNDAAPKIVIEGLITDRRGPYGVSVTESGSYFNETSLPAVSGASVVIKDNSGLTDTLRETTPGVYVTGRTRGFPGRTYTLTVVADKVVYTATSTMLSHVNIDSLKLVPSDFQRFDFSGNNSNELNMEIHCFFKDPPEKNFYRVKVFKNDSINTQSYRLYDDQYTNGEETELRVSRAEAGATYRIELLSIDKATYGFYRTLDDLLYINPFFGSTPANPNTNLSNDALGYFGAAAISSKTIVITDALINKTKNLQKLK
jgi:hypothetical protein